MSFVSQLKNKLTARKRRLIKPGELVAIVAFVVVVGLLTNILISKLTMRRDISDARTVSSKVMADIQRRDGTAVRKLGTATFKKTYSGASLTQEFKHITIATLKPPQEDQQIVVDTSKGRTIFFIYKYTALKVPYYIRTAIMHKSAGWQLTAISGSADESSLFVN